MKHGSVEQSMVLRSAVPVWNEKRVGWGAMEGRGGDFLRLILLK